MLLAVFRADESQEEDMDDELVQNLSELTADIVSAYVSNNTVRPEDQPWSLA